MSIIFRCVLPLPVLLLLHILTITIAFQNHAAVTMKTNQPQTQSRLKDKIHDADDDDLLRDGDDLHNHNHRRTPPDASSSSLSLSDIEARLAAINLTLPPPGGPKANYQLVHRDGNLLYLSGHLPMKPDGTLITGACAPAHIIERDQSTKSKWLSTDQGYEAAQLCALNLLSTLQFYLSTNAIISSTTDPITISGEKRPADLSSVIKIVKLFGIVRSHDDFVEQHLVMNGASDVLKHALGNEVGGCHARSAIGTNSLPLGICVEVEMIAKIAGVTIEQ